jgi:hypothetical protein
MNRKQLIESQLRALGITPEMLGPVEHLPLQATPDYGALVEEQDEFHLGATRAQARDVPSFGKAFRQAMSWLKKDAVSQDDTEPTTMLRRHASMAPAPPESALLPAHSSVMDALGLRIEVDPAGRDLRVISREGGAFQVRPDLHAVEAQVADAAGIARVTLQQDGRFLIESAAGSPMVVGWRDSRNLLLRPVYPWAAPPVEEWTTMTTDRWMQDRLSQGARADAWTRTSLAGQLARLCEPESRDVAALIASGRLQDLVSEVELAPRRWARALPPSEKAALEQQAVRRAEALGDDLTDLFDTLSADMAEASESWAHLCHRRDDIESVRLLLKEAGTGAALDAALEALDRTGRAVRINLEASLTSDDERLRRVALGDPSAWWGSTDFEAHYF